MLVSFIFATVSPAMAGGLAKITDIEGGKGGTTGNAGTIYFGNYWQTLKSGAASGSTNKDNYNKEGIKWRVLANDNNDGSTTNPYGGTKQIFLLSDQGLYADQFNSNTNMGNKWSTSEIRATLTGLASGAASNTVEYADLNTASFAKDAFSAKEYAAIANTSHKAGGSYSNGAVSSTDKIFLLSRDEAINTDYGFTDSTSATDKRKARATEMAKHVKMYGNSEVAYVSSSNSNSPWWLRSPGSDDDGAYYVKSTATSTTTIARPVRL